MRITVKLIGPFVKACGFSEKQLDVDEGITANELIPLIGLGDTRPKILTRNGQALASHETLENGDRIVISPIYSGG